MKPTAGFSADPREFQQMLTFRINQLSASLAAGTVRLYLRAHDLTVAEWRVMMILTQIGIATANDVSRAGLMDKAWVSRSVEGLVDRGILKRQPDPEDQRKHLLHITAKGRKLYDAVRPLAKKRQERMLALLTDEEKATLDRILVKLSGFAETYTGG